MSTDKFAVGKVCRRAFSTKMVNAAYTKQTYNIFDSQVPTEVFQAPEAAASVPEVSFKQNVPAPLFSDAPRSGRHFPGGGSVSDDNVLAFPLARSSSAGSYSSQTLPKKFSLSESVFDKPSAPYKSSVRPVIRPTGRASVADIFSTEEPVVNQAVAAAPQADALPIPSSSSSVSLSEQASIKSSTRVISNPGGPSQMSALLNYNDVPCSVVDVAPKIHPPALSNVFGDRAAAAAEVRPSTKRIFAPGGASSIFSDAPTVQKVRC